MNRPASTKYNVFHLVGLIPIKIKKSKKKKKQQEYTAS
jgi:hypothetical protein